jgi:hypothetical protein
MARNITMNQLTEGIRERKVGAERNRLMEKWNRTGLLRGMEDYGRETMSQLLENQAAQLLREANTLGSQGSGAIDGFTNIAFPIVRRVFGGLIANDLVSIQPMSLPSGLLFYLDYSYGSDIGHDVGDGNADLTSAGATFKQGDSLYGSPNGRSIRTGVDAVGGMYDLAGSGYSLVHSGTDGTEQSAVNGSSDWSNYDANGLGAYNSAGTWTKGATLDLTVDKNIALVEADPQLITDATQFGTSYQVFFITLGTSLNVDKTQAKSFGLISVTDGTVSAQDGFTTFDRDASGNLDPDESGNAWQQGFGVFNLRRLNAIGTWNGSTFTKDVTGNQLRVVLRGTSTADNGGGTLAPLLQLTAPKSDSFTVNSTAGGNEGSTLVIPGFESNFDNNGTPLIPEIDIKIESIAVTAQTRKLRARWSPELAQDLNAYHSLDAEVELTQILSEQIALEIDREILNDLLVEAKGANFFWSRSPGKFVNKRSGALASSTLGPAFHGTVREWYETLVETIIDVANEIHRKTLRGSANFIVCSPEVATIFEASVLYKPTIKIDGQGQTGPEFSIGAQAIGSLSNRFTVYKDPYFPRNKILVGYKGGSYLETGYVYAPYVPLIVTPTIFAPEDFTPRKGVMTRYGKKMVRADFYGTVTCLDMDVI